jgi:hypothetical protein
MPKIFLSYRRNDSTDSVRLIHERLMTRFGPHVFIDMNAIPLGVAFPRYIKSRSREV